RRLVGILGQSEGAEPGLPRRGVRPAVGDNRGEDAGARTPRPGGDATRHRPCAGADGRGPDRPHRRLAGRTAMIHVPRFVPRPPWIGGDLQTLRNFVRPPSDVLSHWPGEEMRFAMKDGTGDELHGVLHRPPDESTRPLVLLLHGLTGSQESSYLRVTAGELLA